MITDIFLGLFLFISSVTDIRSREVKPAVLVLFGLAAVCLYVALRPVGLFEEAAGIVIGLVFVALSLICDGKIGLGDGLLMTVTGVYLGGRQNAFLIMTAMLLSALFSIGILLTGKGGRKTRFAFIPFVFASFLIRVAAGRFL